MIRLKVRIRHTNRNGQADTQIYIWMKHSSYGTSKYHTEIAKCKETIWQAVFYIADICKQSISIILLQMSATELQISVIRFTDIYNCTRDICKCYTDIWKYITKFK